MRELSSNLCRRNAIPAQVGLKRRQNCHAAVVVVQAIKLAWPKMEAATWISQDVQHLQSTCSLSTVASACFLLPIGYSPSHMCKNLEIKNH